FLAGVVTMTLVLLVLALCQLAGLTAVWLSVRSGVTVPVAPARQWSSVHEQGDDHLLNRPRDAGRDSRGRPARRGLDRTRASAGWGRQRLQGPGVESAAGDAVLLRRHRPRARRLSLRF